MASPEESPKEGGDVHTVMALAPFYDTRSQIHRKGTFRPSYGWVSRDSDGVLVLDFDEQVEFAYGEVVKIELLSNETSTAFETTFIGAEESKAIFAAPTSFARGPGRSSARYRGLLDHCKVSRGGLFRGCRVFDVSVGGLAFEFDEMVSTGELLPIELDLGFDRIQFKLRVLYCRSLNADNSSWRVGGSIEAMGRVESVHWKKFLAKAHSSV